MTEKDEEFNRIEREAPMRMEAVSATVAKRKWVEMSDARIKGIFSHYGQFVSGKELALIRTIETMLKENT